MKDLALMTTTTVAGLPTVKADHPDLMTAAHAVRATAAAVAADLLTVVAAAAVVDALLLLPGGAAKP